MELYIYEYHRPKMAKGDEPDVAVIPRCLPRHWELFVTSWPAVVPLFIARIELNLCLAVGVWPTLLCLDFCPSRPSH